MACPGYKYFLSCCALIKNGDKFLKEWLDHYISEGVEHFYLIDNGSSDNTLNIIKQYDNITLFKDNNKYPENQQKMYNDNLLPVIKESKWSMIVDADELMKGQNNYTIKSYLETVPSNIFGIYVIWKMFFNKTNNISKMSEMKSRFNYNYLHDSSMKLNNQVEGFLMFQYFMMFGKTLFRTENLIHLGIHTQSLGGEIIDNFGEKTKNKPETIYQSCKYINESSIKKANIVLNHYFIKTEEEYHSRLKFIKNTWGDGNPRWCNGRQSWIKSLYNLDNKYIIKEI